MLGAREEGVEMAVAAIKEEAVASIERLARAVEWISVGHLNKLIKFFQREGVTHAIMAGQVKHVQIFKLNALPDLRMAKMLARLKRRNMDALIGAVCDELESEGILTGSPAHKQAAEWARDRMKEWGLANPRLEEWEFGRGCCWSAMRPDAAYTKAVFPGAILRAIRCVNGCN